MTARDRGSSRRRMGERGSTSLFFAGVAMALFMVVGLVVDGGGMIKATQEADQIAQQAARQAGQAVSADSIVQGDRKVTLDPAAAKAAGSKYIAAAGATGSVTISGDKIRVQTNYPYRPLFLSIVGIGSLTAEGSAEIDSTRVTKGEG